MTDQIWYKKATVQSALVSGIPAYVTAIIAIIALVTTCINSNKQISLIEKQYSRDSLNSNMQMQILTEQIDIASRSYLFDSLISSKQLEITRTQLHQLSTEVKTRESIDKVHLESTVWNIINELPRSGDYTNAIKSYNIERRKGIAHRIDSLIKSQLNNPIIINNKRFLKKWEYLEFLCRNFRNKEAQYIYTSNDLLFEHFLRNIASEITDVELELTNNLVIVKMKDGSVKLEKINSKKATFPD